MTMGHQTWGTHVGTENVVRWLHSDYTDSTKPELLCPYSETAMSQDGGFISLYFLNAQKPHNRTTVYNHTYRFQEITQADVHVAPSIEGQLTFIGFVHRSGYNTLHLLYRKWQIKQADTYQ